MTSFRRLSLFALPVVLAATIPAYAGPITIDFNGIAGADTSTFSTYSEDGYTVSAFSGSTIVRQTGSGFGDPAPSLYTVSSGTIDIQNTGAPDFIFDSLEFANYSPGSGSYTITGFLSGSQVFSDPGSSTGEYSFASYGSGADSSAIDDLRITFSNGGGMALDNITLVAAPPTVPEPGSIVLLGTGALGLAGAVRRRFSAR